VADPEWAQLVDKLQLGDHVILLYNDIAGLTPPTVRFITQGLRNNELVVALIPVAELAMWRDVLDEALRAVGAAESTGALQIIPLLASRLTADTGPLDAVPLIRSMLREAKADNRRGVRLVGRLSPALLERGFERNAVAIEKFAAEQHFPVKVLCLYDAASLAKVPVTIVEEIVGAHTHSIAHIAEGLYLVESF